MAYDRELGRRFWYELDKRTLHNPAFGPLMGQSGAGEIQDRYFQAREDGTYPAAFRQFVQPRGAAWLKIADLQTRVMDEFLPDPADLQRAFEDFGQGVLHDDAPERAPDDMIHTMDTGNSPPIGYSRWHASIRAIQSLNPADPDRWTRLASLVALAWAIQSAQRPKQQDKPNPDMAADRLQELRDLWLPLTPSQLDAQYDLTGSVGYHPDPFHPTLA